MICLRLLLLLPFSIALANETELFEPVSEPDKTWEHYTNTFFPEVKKGSGVLHWVTIPSLKKTVDCLSIVQDRSDGGDQYYIYSRKLSRDGEIALENKRLEITIMLSSSLRNLSSAALNFTGDSPLPPRGLDGTSTLLFVDSYRKPLGTTNSPDKKSVPARVIRFFEALWEDLEDGAIDEEAWIDRSRALKDNFPKLPWSPTYSEFLGADLLRDELEVMKEWQLTHRVRHLDFNGYKDSESIRFREELAGTLAEVAPSEWKGLMNSSGNMHNPKVTPIRPFLDEATRKTKSVELINEILAEYQLKVSGLSVEKLSFATKTGGGLPSAMMHFKVAPIE